MKRFSLNTGLVFASWALLLMFGCHKKKPNIPPEQTPPTIISQIPIQDTEPPAQPQTPPAQPQIVEKEPEKPVRPPRRPRTHSPTPKKSGNETEKPAPTEEAKNIPPSPPATPRVVIQDGGTNSGTGAVTGNSSNDNDSTTQQLLQTAEKNLSNIKRQLSTEEQAVYTQIQDYIKQSRDATRDGDKLRAHTLAFKAQLLSDELVKKQ